MKLSREYSEIQPEFDRVQLSVVEDSWLHLSFLYEAYGTNEIRVVLTDTMMLGKEVTAQAAYKIRDIDDNRVELVTEYKLTKGRHYSLTIYYIGGPQYDYYGQPKCSVYDATISISHAEAMMHATRCPSTDDVPSLINDLPKKIEDHDLDRNGEYIYEKLLKLDYPKDFKGLS